MSGQSLTHRSGVGRSRRHVWDAHSSGCKGRGRCARTSVQEGPRERGAQEVWWWWRVVVGGVVNVNDSNGGMTKGAWEAQGAHK